MSDEHKILHAPVFPVLFNFKLCGVPGFCDLNADETCSNISLNECPQCSSVASGFFVFFITCLALVILIGNLLVILVYNNLRKKQNATKFDLCKVSLALADAIAGFLIFFVAIPNYSWTTTSSMVSIVFRVEDLSNSAQVVAGGFFYLLGYTASLYHLLFLGIMRLYAIKRPMEYNQMSMRSIYIGLGITWCCAAIVASFPAWFQQQFAYDFNPVVFFYLPSLKEPSLSQSEPLATMTSTTISSVLSLFLILGIPYLIMTILSISTALVVRKSVRSSQKQLRKESNTGSNNGSFSKREIKAFKTLAMMQVGFTLTLLPIGIIAVLFYTEYLTCNSPSYSPAYLICFYLSMSNSLVNFIIYSAREKKFRDSVRDIFQSVGSQVTTSFVSRRSAVSNI